MTALLGDSVNSKLLGMSKVVSDDSARRALKKMDEDEAVSWLQKHPQQSYEPLLASPWILDSDVTIKPVYGHQEGAEVGYNPHKLGRPSHTYHTYMTRLPASWNCWTRCLVTVGQRLCEVIATGARHR